MGQSADQIRREIDQSRDNAADKIDQLQSQIQGTAQDVKESVQGTAEKVVDDLKGTVTETVETVRENLDLREHIKQRPMVSLGIALVGGFLLGGMSGSDGQARSSHSGNGYGYPQPDNGHNAGYRQSGGSAGGISQGIRMAVQKTGLEDTISNAAAALIGSMTDQVKSTIDQNFPGFADKMKTAQSSSGDFTEKAKEAQG